MRDTETYTIPQMPVTDVELGDQFWIVVKSRVPNEPKHVWTCIAPARVDKDASGDPCVVVGVQHVSDGGTSVRMFTPSYQFDIERAHGGHIRRPIGEHRSEALRELNDRWGVASWEMDDGQLNVVLDDGDRAVIHEDGDWAVGV